MSLEALLERVAVAMERNADLLEKIAAGKPGGAAETEKPKTTRKTKAKAEDAGDGDGEGGDGDDAVDTKKLKATLEKVKGWLKEFAETEDDPENEARSEALDAALEKLEVEKISAITSEAMRVRAETWIDKKIAAGRITPAPKKAAKGGDDDDI